MIKIFLLNIILTVSHLAVYETKMEWFGLNENINSVFVDIGSKNQSQSFDKHRSFLFDNPKYYSQTFDFVASSLHFKSAECRKIKNIRFSLDSFRKRFMFFMSGVSPPQVQIQ